MSSFAVTAVVPRLPTRDVVAAADFYVQHFGFRVGSVWPDGKPTFVILERDGVSLQFTVTEQPLNSDTTICLDVPDALAVHQALKNKLPVEWGPEVYSYGRREFAVRDCNGYLVIFSEETSDPPTCTGD